MFIPAVYTLFIIFITKASLLQMNKNHCILSLYLSFYRGYLMKYCAVYPLKPNNIIKFSQNTVIQFVKYTVYKAHKFARFFRKTSIIFHLNYLFDNF